MQDLGCVLRKSLLPAADLGELALNLIDHLFMRLGDFDQTVRLHLAEVIERIRLVQGLLPERRIVHLSVK